MELTTSFVVSRNCFVSLPEYFLQQAFERLPQQQQISAVIVELRWKDEKQNNLQKKAIVGYGAPTRSNSTIEIDPQFAQCLGISNGQRISVRLVPNVVEAKMITVQPASPDDWELLELHAEQLEHQILNQIFVVSEKQTFPLWIDKAVIKVLVSSVDPKPSQIGCVRLIPNTEFAIAPKLRKNQNDEKATVSKSLLENPVKRSKQIVRLLKKPNLKNTIVVGSMICFVDSISISRELANKLQISDKDLFWKLVSPHSHIHTFVRVEIKEGIESPHVRVDSCTFKQLQVSQYSRVWMEKLEVERMNVENVTRVVLKYDSPTLLPKDQLMKALKRWHTSLSSSVKFIPIHNGCWLKLTNQDGEEWLLQATFHISTSQNQAQQQQQQQQHQQESPNKQTSNQSNASRKNGGNDFLLSLENFASCEIILDRTSHQDDLQTADSEESSQIQNEQTNGNGILTTNNHKENNNNNNNNTNNNNHKETHEQKAKQRALQRQREFFEFEQLNNNTHFQAPSTIFGFQNQFRKCFDYFSDIFDNSKSILRRSLHVSSPQCMLIHGSHGSGKTFFSERLMESLSSSKLLYVTGLKCSSLTESKLEHIKEKFTHLFKEAVANRPSIVLIDDLDLIVPSSASEEGQPSSSDDVNSTQIAEFLIDLIEGVYRFTTQDTNWGPVAILATSQSTVSTSFHELIHKRHLFSMSCELSVPDLESRADLLDSLLKGKCIESNFLNNLYNRTSKSIEIRNGLLLPVAKLCEGFLSGDFEQLVERSLSELSRRYLNLLISSSTANDFRFSNTSVLSSSNASRASAGKTNTTNTNMTTNGDLSVNNHATHFHGALIQSNDEESKEIEITKNLKLEMDDFKNALVGFVPINLKGIKVLQDKDGGSGGGSSSGSGGDQDAILKWEEIGGLEAVKQTLQETLLWPAKYPKIFERIPLRTRSGILLFGPPGCGKTLLANAVARQFGLNFISVKGPELLNKYIGAAEQKVREIFARAQQAKPCVLFFDEFDSLAPRRGHDSTGVTDRVVNQLLTQLDGVESLQGVYVLGATSRPDLIDPALLRPGRLDKSLYCGMPTNSERLSIFKAISKRVSFADDVELEEINKQCENYTGADIQALVYNAQLEVAHETLQQLRSARSANNGNGKSTNGTSNVNVIGSFDKSSVEEKKLIEDLTERISSITSLKEKSMLTTTTTNNNLNVSGIVSDSSNNTNNTTTSTTTKTGSKLTREHMLKALRSSRKSVSDQERRRYELIYKDFLESRGEIKTVSLPTEPGKRSTLA